MQTSSPAITERPRCRVGWSKVEDWKWETIFPDIITRAPQKGAPTRAAANFFATYQQAVNNGSFELTK